MARDPYRYFRIEARELFEQLSRDTLDLENRYLDKNVSPELVGRLLRAAHTLKGAARVVKRTDIGDYAHAIEDVLEPLRGADRPATAAAIDALLKLLDQINAAIATLAEPVAGAEPVPPAAVQPPVAPVTAAPVAIASASASLLTPIVEPEALQSVRVEINEMDNMLNGFGEVYTQLENLRQGFGQFETIRALIGALGTRLRAESLHRSDADFDMATPVATATTFDAKRRVADTQALLQQLTGACDGFGRNFDNAIDQIDRELSNVRAAAERIRLVPTNGLFVALERATRDAAQIYGKAVQFEARAGDIRLDADALVIVQVALSHAVRNAVAHGLETAEQRRAAGKNPVGTVSVDIAQRGKQLMLTCRDDGRGIDFDAIRAVAKQRGVREADAASADTLLQLLLKGGISTSATVTEVAGRGIGLDAIRDAAERLGGKLSLHSQPGRGTTLTLTTPLFLAALDVLRVEYASHSGGNQVAAIPLDAVRRTYRIAPTDMVPTAQGMAIEHDGRSIPFRPLALALAPGQSGDWFARTWSAVVIGVDDHAAAIGVERLRGTASLVVQPLPPLTPTVRAVVGIALDAAGSPQLVFDPAALLDATAAAQVVLRPEARERLPILVIDDSLTTRMLERSILESAGYEVELAISAEDALDKAKHTRYALFLVDVEMPGMDGFGFVEHIRADATLCDIPAVLVTSRVSPEDLQRGKAVGADHHIAKSAFDQDEFLTYIRELVG
jgi:two-component system chemotaxis sensor kinase CheA